MNYTKNLKTIVFGIAIGAGLCAIVGGIFKWHMSPSGDIDAGQVQPVTARLAAAEWFFVGTILVMSGCFGRYLNKRKP
jgi:hypothetical protein